MNSYQVLEQETNAALESNDDVKLKDILRRIKNLMVSPTCAGYPWNNLVSQITAVMRKVDADATLNAILNLRERERSQVDVNRIAEDAQVPVSELEDLSDSFLQSWSTANTKRANSGKRRHG